MTKRILITGKNGQLGRSLFKLIKDFTNISTINPFFIDFSDEEISTENNFFFTSREELDLSNPNLINQFFQNQQFDGIVNCAAYTLVDKAESNVELAEQINHHAVANLAEVAKNQSIPLIHISTDYVFNGRESKAYKETDEAHPQNVYGLTKLKGERAMQVSGCKGAIIRTSWLYSEYGNNFVKTMLGLAKDNDSLNVVNDQVGSPTYATNLAKLLLLMLNKRQTIEILNSQLHVYHFSDEGICSWYEFAKAIFDLSNINCMLKPIETKDYPLPAKRPYYNVMNKDKIKNHLLGLVIPHWRDSLITCLQELKRTEFY